MVGREPRDLGRAHRHDRDPGKGRRVRAQDLHRPGRPLFAHEQRVSRQQPVRRGRGPADRPGPRPRRRGRAEERAPGRAPRRGEEALSLQLDLLGEAGEPARGEHPDLLGGVTVRDVLERLPQRAPDALLVPDRIGARVLFVRRRLLRRRGGGVVPPLASVHVEVRSAVGASLMGTVPTGPRAEGRTPDSSSGVNL